MIAHIGLPGNSFHYWRRFLGKGAKRRANAWLDRQVEWQAEHHPARTPVVAEVISERAAESARWLDGSQVYGRNSVGILNPEEQE